MRPHAVLGSLLAVLVLTGCGHEAPSENPPASAPVAEFALDFSDEEDVPPGSFADYAAARGFTRVLGNPVWFSVRGGALHLAARPGPVHAKRRILALTDRAKLRRGLESKVILRLTRDGFSLDLARRPVLRFRMAPLRLPGRGADLRDSSRNDACFYLLLGLDGPRHDLGGIPMPDTLAYVWANRPWPEEHASDPDYESFLRYVAVGQGEDRLGEEREIVRNVTGDLRSAFPRRTAAPVLRSVAVMVDSNTVGTESRSTLRWVRLEERR
ncbi:MAG: DUF3047 domain-containing protein [Planctomycetota bacterium]